MWGGKSSKNHEKVLFVRMHLWRLIKYEKVNELVVQFVCNCLHTYFVLVVLVVIINNVFSNVTVVILFY